MFVLQENSLPKNFFRNIWKAMIRKTNKINTYPREHYELETFWNIFQNNGRQFVMAVCMHQSAVRQNIKNKDKGTETFLYEYILTLRKCTFWKLENPLLLLLSLNLFSFRRCWSSTPSPTLSLESREGLGHKLVI